MKEFHIDGKLVMMFTDWKINVYSEGSLLFSQDFDLEGKRVS